MGNKLTRPFVDEKYTRPQGLDDAKDMDYRKIRRLILNGQLAPCFPGVEECTSDLDECPICFMFYPSLNRSRCCAKAICTECYLQVKSAQFARSMQCPFCKTSSYSVEFRGAKTVEEKGVEQAEEQKVIEAKIRIRQKELYDEAERMRRLGANTQAGQLEDPVEHETNHMLMEPGMSVQAVQGSIFGLNRNDGFDLDIEDTMLMEAILLSIQEQGEAHQEFALAQQSPTLSSVTEKCFLDSNQISTGIAGQMGLTGAVAVLAEGQVMNAESRGADRAGSSNRNLPGSDRTSNANHSEILAHEFQGLPKDLCSNRASEMDKQDFSWEKWKNGESSQQNARFGSEEFNGWPNVSKGNSFWSVVQREDRDLTFDLGLDQSSSEVAEAGTSFSSSIPSASGLPWESTDNDGETSSSSALATMLPVSFEDQIMLAMALSLADAQAEARRP